MADQAVMASQNVLFHGVWLAHYTINDKLIRSIGQDFSSKPARASKFTLSREGISLEIHPTQDGKPGRVEKIALDAVRDITFNRYNTQCLMVVYVDKKNMFSIMVCSSPDDRDILIISRAYKDYKSSQLLNQGQQNQGDLNRERNWTLRQKQLQAAAAAAATTEGNAGSTNNNSNSNGPQNMSRQVYMDTQNRFHNSRILSNGTDNSDDDIFLLGDVEVIRDTENLQREPAQRNGEGDTQAFNVGVQTSERGSAETDSIMSSGSIQSLRDDLYSLSEEMKAIKFLLEKSTGISSEEYYRRRDMQGNRHAVAFHTRPKMVFNGDEVDSRPVNSSQPETKESPTNGEPPQKERVRFADADVVMEDKQEKKVTQNGHSQANGDHSQEEEDFDLRSVGMQTDQGAKAGQIVRNRYQKRPTGSASNVYRDKQAASRKRSNNSSTSSIPDSPNSPNSPIGGSLRLPSNGSGQTYYTGSWGSRSSSLKMSAPSTHVEKPIESVYQNYTNTGSRGFNNRRNNKLIIIPAGSRPGSSSSPPAKF